MFQSKHLSAWYKFRILNHKIVKNLCFLWIVNGNIDYLAQYEKKKPTVHSEFYL